jgi:hypothetical protein
MDKKKFLGIKQQDPSEVLDYEINYTDWLASGATISTTTFTALRSGITIGTVSNTSTAAKFWVAGTNTGKYPFKNTTTDSGGRQVVRYGVIEVVLPTG